ncbi:hypothetical protein [Plantactinospora sp. B24E8]|uniref:hypothetical protein n=1 Tax=Plantactinospora sp. B24E8 TaxID=3153567 RepID=UPI00325F0FAD
MVMRDVAALARPGREHPPRRPTWTCRTCENDWPCAAARVKLPAEFRLDPLALFVYLGICLYEATADLCTLNPNPGPDPIVLHARFLGWVPERRLIIGALARRYADGWPAVPTTGTGQTPAAPDMPDTGRITAWPNTNSGP